MGPLVVVELQKPIERGLEPASPREVLPTERDAPLLVQNGLLQPLHEAIRPCVSRLRARDANPRRLAARRERALEFLAVVREDPLHRPPRRATAGPHDLDAQLLIVRGPRRVPVAPGVVDAAV